jgi:hypothetical protein
MLPIASSNRLSLNQSDIGQSLEPRVSLDNPPSALSATSSMENSPSPDQAARCQPREQLPRRTFWGLFWGLQKYNLKKYSLIIGRYRSFSSPLLGLEHPHIEIAGLISPPSEDSNHSPFGAPLLGTIN